MNLDIGNNARIEKIVMSAEGLRITARTLISSKKNIIIRKRARFFYDLGAFRFVWRCFFVIVSVCMECFS